MLQLVSKLIREDNFLSLSGNVIIAALGFGGFALLARTLSPADFAQWVLFISGGSLVEMLRYGITNNGLVRFLSGADATSRKQFIGSNVIISLLATVVVALLLVGIRLLFVDTIDNSAYALFFTWYPLLAFLNLPFNNAMVVLQAEMAYGKILGIKALNSGLFFTFLLVNTLFIQLGIAEIVLVFLMVNALTSLFCIVKSWDGLKLAGKADRSTIKTLLNFGKYSTFTLVGTNLLRNADVLLISISPFGSEAVALFSIPLKLTELQQIPLRSFAATAFPKMSRASMQGNLKEVQELFNVYSGALTYLFLVGSLFTFVFAKEFVILISGYQYLDAASSGMDIVALVRILSVYGLLLPLDRMTGIGLDSINRPNINALKVTLMLATNIVGDLIAIYVFQSLEMVAVATLVFTAVGIWIGGYYLNQAFTISPFQIWSSTNGFYKNLLAKSRLFQRGIKVPN